MAERKKSHQTPSSQSASSSSAHREGIVCAHVESSETHEPEPPKADRVSRQTERRRSEASATATSVAYIVVSIAIAAAQTP
ncbi:hypothetical protein EXIGLDRAFT_86175 [Exidia glandulosa HHB12029]|uniref:Uncharacterized protein n=1 Tax=Exidia glandulosa HHB12029 TaxID=1314781 RepID=A0A165HES7_EXIGL|nr:hypothetical protein EXIGLDRAFT_86175 [Exidia glandulosa HHB12029]